MNKFTFRFTLNFKVVGRKEVFENLVCLCWFSFLVLLLLDLSYPNFLVGEFTKHVQSKRKHKTQQEKDDSLWQVEDIEHGIDPNVGFELNDMNPAEISGHEDRESSDTGFAWRVFSEWREQLHNDEDHDVGVHNVIKPA